MKALKALLANQRTDVKPWVLGNIPYHYKRINIPFHEALRLAKIGTKKIKAYYNDKLYFTQAVIAGACLTDDYDTVIIVTSSQYGKSWLMGRIVPIRAYEEKSECYIAGGDADKTAIIQNYMFRALQEVTPEMRNALNSESKDKLDKLATSVSKTKISFRDGGSIEPLSLGENFNNNLARNKSVGRGGDYFVDEAALLSDDTYAELGRRDFKNKDGKRSKQVLISNPHNPGMFYDKLTDENPDDKTLIIWMDILTAVEEGQTTAERVIHSDFAKNKSTRRRYLMCELDVDSDAMFGTPKIYKEDDTEYKQNFMGVDPSYKGKDSIETATVSVDEDGFFRVEEIEKMDRVWIDGATSEDIAKDIARKARVYNAGLVAVDVGWGVWLTESLTRRRVNTLGVAFQSSPTKSRVRANHYAATNAQNKRSEMHLDLQDLIENNMIAFQEDAWNKVKDTFPFVTAERKENGKIQIRKKSEIKRSIGHSPDELDSVLLAIHAAIRFLEGAREYIA